MFSGSIVALVTPMHADGAIDWVSYDRLIQFHLDNRTDGLVLGGTTGESPVLTTEELVQLLSRAKERCRGRIPVIAGSGTNSTAKTVELSRSMESAGADALLVVTPYYNKPSQEGLIQHYTAVADAVRIPVIPYNVPSRTAVDMLASTIVQLSFHPRIVAVKEATGIVERCSEILSSARSGFVVLSGDDLTYVDLMRVGAKGIISVTANVAPRALHDVCAAALEGDFSRAQQIDEPLRKLHKALFLEANPIPVKWVMTRLGFGQEGIRLPLTKLHSRFHAPLMEALAAAGIRFA